MSDITREGYKRLSAILNGDSSGWGEHRSFVNFVQCKLARRIQDLQPLAEWWLALGLGPQGANLTDPEMAGLIDEWLRLHRLVLECGRVATLPSHSMAPHDPQVEGCGWTVRYDWQARQWTGYCRHRLETWPTHAAMLQFLKRAAL